MAFFYDSDYVSPQESDLEAPPAISSVMPDPAIQRENAEKITSWVEDIASISRHLTQIRATLEKCKSKQEQPQQEGENTDSADTLVERLDALIAFQTDIEEAFWLTKALCKLTGKDLKRLGVVREAVPVPIEPIRRGLRKALGTNNLNLYEEAADAKAQALHSDLLSLTGRVIMNSEASARIPIDSCIIHVSALCDGRFRLGGLPAGKLFLITETSVPRVKSGPQDSKEHPVLRNVGALAGRLDYLLTKVPGYLDGIKPRECQVLNNALDDFAEAPTSITDLDDLARPGVLLTVVEAKRFDIKDDALLEAVPQAIGEALVLGHRLRNTEGLHRTIPLILTNGSQWVFGFLEPRFKNGESPKWHYYQSEIHQILREESKRLSKRKISPLEVSTIRILIDVMMFWTNADRISIGEVVKESVAAGKEKDSGKEV